MSRMDIRFELAFDAGLAMNFILGLHAIMIGPRGTEADQDQTSGSTRLHVGANPGSEGGFFDVASSNCQHGGDTFQISGH